MSTRTVLFVGLVFCLAVLPVVAFSQSGWERQTSGTTENLYDVCFPDSAFGVAVGDLVTIVRTTDGGQTWESGRVEVEGGLLSVSLLPSGRGAAVGGGPIITTDDRGESWVVRQQEWMATYYDLKMFTDTTGIAVGYSMNFEVLTTRTWDDWQSWEDHSSYIEHDGALYPGRLFGCDFLDTTLIYGAGLLQAGGGVVARTVDGGVNWTAVCLCDYLLCAVDFCLPVIGYAVGENGTIMKTADGGANWQTLHSGVDVTLWDICLVEADFGYAVGENGIILRTSNGGETWIPQNSGTTQSLRAVQFFNANVGFVVGESGTILHTTTGGEPPSGCQYVLGDINGDRAANGMDVCYGVNYFKGGAPPPVSCDCPPIPAPFYAAGDVNGGCVFNGIDITYFVNFLKGIGGAPEPCVDCPPSTIVVTKTSVPWKEKSDPRRREAPGISTPR